MMRLFPRALGTTAHFVIVVAVLLKPADRWPRAKPAA